MTAPSAPTPIVSVLIVSYNTGELTLECLASLYRETSDLPFETIVVDNASADGSADKIREAFPGVQLHALDENLGFGRGSNLAAKHASGRYLVLLNPDTVVLDRAIERIVAYAESHQGCGILGGRTLNPDGSLNPTSAWAAPSLWSQFCQATCLSTLFRGSALFDPRSMGSWQRDSEREVEVVSGCFMLLTADFWNELGGFDERFFMYGEDVDLNLRARSSGRPSWLVPEATIIHAGAASEPVKADKLVRLLRAERQLWSVHGSVLARALVSGLQLAGVGVRALGEKLRRRAASDEARGAWLDAWCRREEWR